MTELFLRARVGTRWIAVAANQVIGVIDVGEVIAVPLALPGVRGLAAMRSRVFTVIDTSVMLGLAPLAQTARRAVTARIDGHHYAFLADALDDIASFEPTSLPAGLPLSSAWARAATGLIDCDGTPHLILDLASLVRMAQAA